MSDDDTAMQSVLDELGWPDSVTLGEIIQTAEQLNRAAPRADLRELIEKLGVWSA